MIRVPDLDRRWRGGVGDLRLVVDVVDPELDAMLDAAGLDDRHAHRLGIAALALAIEHVAHGENGLERVALRAAGRRHVGLAAGDPDRVVEDRLDGARSRCRRALSWIEIDPGSTAIEITGATSASSQASSALSTSSLSTTSGHSSTPCPVWFCSSRLVQNSISRETRKATRVSFGSGFACERTAWALPQFVKTETLAVGFLAC